MPISVDNTFFFCFLPLFILLMAKKTSTPFILIYLHMCKYRFLVLKKLSVLEDKCMSSNVLGSTLAFL